MKFILLYELSNREFDNLVLLKRELVKRGHTVEICSKFGSMRLKYEEFILFVPNAYRNGNIDFYRYVYYTKNNAIVVYPCEQVTNRQMPDFYDFSDNNCVKFLPTLCWGEDYYDFLKELGYKNKYTSIVGAIQLDFCRERFVNLYDDRKLIAQKFHLPLNKKWILFISDFVYSNIEMGNRFIKGRSLSETTVLSMRKYESELQEEILAWFDSFLKNNNEYIIIYRKHPVEVKNELLYSFEKKHKNQFYEISEMNIKQWIILADKVCTYNSTAIIECAAAKKECILLRPHEFPKESAIKEYPFYIGYPRVKNEDEFKRAMISNTNDFVSTEQIKYLYDVKEKFSYERVADILEKIAKEQPKMDIDLKHYQISRIKFLVKKNIIFKVWLKFLYTKMRKIIRFKPGKENILAKKEWIASENNIKYEHILGEKIDKIITQL